MKFILAGFILLSILCAEIYGKTYYIQNKTQLNWHAAFENCALQGWQMATILTKNEQNTLEKTIKAAGLEKTSFWIGGSDLAKEGSFVWTASGEPFSYTNWLPDQPDNKNINGVENCVDIWPFARNTFEWNDAPCNNPKYFICEDQPKNCYNNEDITVECERLT